MCCILDPSSVLLRCNLSIKIGIMFSKCLMIVPSEAFLCSISTCFLRCKRILLSFIVRSSEADLLSLNWRRNRPSPSSPGSDLM